MAFNVRSLSLFAAALVAPTALALDISAEATSSAFFQSKTVIIPKDKTRFRGGEDAADSSTTCLTVADGVGGWADKGVNPAFFSRTLVQTIIDSEQPGSDLLDLVVEGCAEADSQHLGSATVTALKVLDGQRLSGVNMGDSGYTLFRIGADGALAQYHQSESLQRMFNFPYQCNSDLPAEKAKKEEIVFSDGDVIFMYSDGFIDNVYFDDAEMLACVNDRITADGLVDSLGAASDCLARYCYSLSKDTTYKSPFEAEYERAFKSGEKMNHYPSADDPFIGGKQDDITITVAQVFVGPEGDARRSLASSDPFMGESVLIHTDETLNGTSSSTVKVVSLTQTDAKATSEKE